MSTLNKRRIPILVVATLCLLFAGIIYAWSIFKSPLETEFGWDTAQLGLNFTITMGFFCLGGLVSGLLSKKTSAFLRLTVSALLMLLGFFLTSKLTADTLWLLYIAYGVIMGTGIGIAYNTILSTTAAWFPDKKGLCSGVMLFGFGFSTLIIGNIAGNLMASSDVDWRDVFLALGAISATVIFLSAFVIVPPTADVELPKPLAAAAGNAPDMSTKDMIKRAAFWKMFFFFLLLGAVGSTVISFAKDFSMSFGISASVSVTLVGILSLFNGLGRLLAGSLFDRWGIRKTQYFTSALAILAPLVALIAVLVDVQILAIVGLCLCGLSYGFSPTLSAAFTMYFYGAKNFALNLSVINLNLIFASFVSTIAGGMLQSSGYLGVFILLTAGSVVGLFINLSIKQN